MNVRLKAPKKFQADVNVWVDEAIWGHRLYNDQTPWLVLLEFLAIFRWRFASGKALDEVQENSSHESIKYYIPRLIPLRQLIFNNPHIQYVEDNCRSDAERWETWFDSFTTDESVEYLRKRFGSFSRFARVVEFFQTTAVEAHRQRRWSSRFLFPYGPNCVYADLPVNANRSPDRRFFARSGELLYLMLCRSGSGVEIADQIAKKLLREDETWNRVVQALLPEGYLVDANSVSSTIGYLPFAMRDEYVELANTWMRLLRLELSGESLLDPLMRLSVLHMLLYTLRRSNEEIGDSTEPKFVLEIASPKRTTIFELAKENFAANRMLSTRAVRAYVDAAKRDRQWEKACQARVPADAVRRYLSRRFAWNIVGSPPAGDPGAIFKSLRTYAVTRHQQHVAKVHMEWTRHIGLSVLRRGAGTWYSPDDSLLKALVMCIADEGREEYHRFLEKLYDRFRLIVGVSQAERRVRKPTH